MAWAASSMSGKAAFAGARGVVDQRLRRRELDRHVGELPLQALELVDRPAELDALLRPVECEPVGTLRDAERHRGGADALAVVGGHQVGEALLQSARRDDQGRGRQVDLLAVDHGLRDAAQPHGRLAPGDLQALGLVADRKEAADALLALLVVHLGEDQVQARHAAAGDPVLAAVDDEAVALRSARVVMPPASEPASGSVMQMAGLSPDSTMSAASFFWSSEP